MLKALRGSADATTSGAMYNPDAVGHNMAKFNG